ncbi:unnamed protein product, partial [Gulo gulo]
QPCQGVGRNRSGLGLASPAKKLRDRGSCIFLYCHFHPAFPQLIYEVGKLNPDF